MCVTMSNPLKIISRNKLHRCVTTVWTHNNDLMKLNKKSSYYKVKLAYPKNKSLTLHDGYGKKWPNNCRCRWLGKVSCNATCGICVKNSTVTVNLLKNS